MGFVGVMGFVGGMGVMGFMGGMGVMGFVGTSSKYVPFVLLS